MTGKYVREIGPQKVKRNRPKKKIHIFGQASPMDDSSRMATTVRAAKLNNRRTPYSRSTLKTIFLTVTKAIYIS